MKKIITVLTLAFLTSSSLLACGRQETKPSSDSGSSEPSSTEPSESEEHVHDLVFVVDTPSTTDAEGSGHYTCKSEDCDYVGETLKIMKIPTYSIAANGTTIIVNEVPNAQKYYYALGDEKVELPAERQLNYVAAMATKDLSFFATTEAEGYYEASPNSAKVKILDGEDDLRAPYNVDFERTSLTIKAGSQWATAWPYANFSGFDWEIVCEEDGNACGKMPATGFDKFDIGVHKDLSGLNGAGTYIVSFDVKLSAKAEASKTVGSVYANINHDGQNGFSAANFQFGNLSAANSTSWTRFSGELTKPATGWAQIVMFYNFCGDSSIADILVDNYILIDNIEFTLKGSSSPANLDTLGDENGAKAGRFDKWSLKPATSTNYYTYMDTVYLETTSIGCEVIKEENGNHAFKVYNQLECCEFNFHLGNDVNAPGLYKLVFDIKLGSESALHNLGFRGWSGPVKAIEDTQINFSAAKKGEWVTVSCYFDSLGHIEGGLPTQDNVNIFFWSFADNNNIKSEENYFLLDNVHLYMAELQA